MKISQIFNLNKTQAELDFVDIDPTTDLPLFIDPFYIGKRKDNWSYDVNKTIDNFFNKILYLISNQKIIEGKKLFRHFGEPNETCLGVSIGKPQGKGVGQIDTDKLFNSFLKSNAIHSGLIKDLEDSVLFVDNFGKDKLSDMTTNIIMRHLINYTQSQCDLHGIPLTSGISTGQYWNANIESWESEYTDMLVIGSKKIVLVPKSIVSYSLRYTPNNFLQHFMLNFLQNEFMKTRPNLVQNRVDGTPYITKKSIKEEVISGYSSEKEFLREYTKKYPQVLSKFKRSLDNRPLKNAEIDEKDVLQVSKNLISKLKSIPSGSATANDYHELIKGILELIFYPNLTNPVKEKEINSGRKRVDIVFDNASESGIFYRLSEKFKIPCPYIFIECKNYSSDIKNPELDQIAGRFSNRRGKVGFILCRKFEDRQFLLTGVATLLKMIEA